VDKAVITSNRDSFTASSGISLNAWVMLQEVAISEPESSSPYARLYLKNIRSAANWRRGKSVIN
jgi:hypothetical protein